MIVEAKADVDVLSTVLSEHHETTVRIETLDTSREIPLRSVFWAQTDSLEALEEALERDPTVVHHRRLAALNGAGLYRARHPPETSMADFHGSALGNDALLLDATGQDEHWWFKLWLPDRESLTGLRDACEQTPIDLSVVSMYHDQPHPVGDLYGLTESQREVLLLAAEMGYFSIPRENSLSDLADELDLSSQAVSERLRRGMNTLVNTILVNQSPFGAGDRLGQKRS
jgi:predicted DNA binding protein